MKAQQRVQYGEAWKSPRSRRPETAQIGHHNSAHPLSSLVPSWVVAEMRKATDNARAEAAGMEEGKQEGERLGGTERERWKGC